MRKLSIISNQLSVIPKSISSLLSTAYCLLPYCLLSTSPIWAEMQGNTILDVSSRMSRDMKIRVQEHLNRIFGFGKSEVFIQVDVGFSPTVRSDLERTLKSYLSGEATRSEAAAAVPSWTWTLNGGIN